MHHLELNNPHAEAKSHQAAASDLSKVDIFLNRLRLWQKFALLAVIGSVLVATPFFLYIQETGKGIDATQNERHGLAPLRQLMNSLELMQQHRGLSAMVLGGNAAARTDRDTKRAQTNATLAELEQMLHDSISDATIVALWQDTLTAWQQLITRIDQNAITASESFNAHIHVIDQLLRLKSLLMQAYGLSFDPEAQGFYLIDIALNRVPILTEMFGRARAIGAGILERHDATTEERMQVRILINQAEDHLTSLKDSVASLTKHFPQLNQAALAKATLAASTGSDAAIVLAREKVIMAEDLQFAATEYFARLTESIDTQYQLSTVVMDQLETLLVARADRLKHTRYLLAGIIILFSLLAAWANYLITRALLRQLGGEPAYATSILNQISTGNLAVPIQLKPNDRSSLLFAMLQMRDYLAAIVGSVRSSADSIASASIQISTSNLDLSSRTEHQASSLAQTAATMAQINATVQQNADSAQQANTLATTATRTATAGGTIVTGLVETMGEITTRSRQVADIIGVIDSIAFQTNLLALNAAVEAARAGVQGRSFAVVAAEVRALAQRSAGAAKEIKTLIDTTVDAITSGNEQAAHAGATMQDIVDGITRVTDIMGEISVASREQANGIAEINIAVTQMDVVTHQNASLVEDSATAATSLKSLANSLSRQVAIFNIDTLDNQIRSL
ncbi:methyl-accepting chemotaxis protein [Alcaligenaceae bacterium CGII-47]|nr:methyl-accepting chemotaxis protein [Alcaligenaceae bacterium CGII-47]